MVQPVTVKPILPRLKDAEEQAKKLEAELNDLKEKAQMKPGAPTWQKTASGIIASTAFYVGPLVEALRSCASGPCDGAALSGNLMRVVGSAMVAAAVIEPIGAVALIAGSMLAALFGSSEAGPPPITLQQLKEAIRSELQNFEEKKILDFDLPTWNEEVWTTYHAINQWVPANDSQVVPPDQAQSFLTFLNSGATIFRQNHEIQRSWRVVVDSPDSSRVKMIHSIIFNEDCHDHCNADQKWAPECADGRQPNQDRLAQVGSFLQQYYAVAIGFYSIQSSFDQIRKQPGWEEKVGRSLDAYNALFKPMFARAYLANYSLSVIPSCYSEDSAFGSHCSGTRQVENCPGHDVREFVHDCNFGDSHFGMRGCNGCDSDNDCVRDWGPGAFMLFSCNGRYLMCGKPVGCANQACHDLMKDEGAWSASFQ